MLAKNMPCETLDQFFHIDAENAVIEVIHCDGHNHETDDRVVAHNQFLNNAKCQFSDDSTKPVKRLYDQQVALAHRNAATRGGRDRSSLVPEFSFVRSQLLRTRSKLLPQVPHDADAIII